MDRSTAPLEFAIWDVQPDTVRDNVSRFVTDTEVQVRVGVIDGPYHSILGAEFSAGRGPDVFHAQRAEAALWGSEGHLEPLDRDHPTLSPVLARMDPRLVDGARDGDGRLLGLTYYNGGPFALFLRQGVEVPTTWRGFLDVMRDCKRNGLSRHPFVPRWHSGQTGLVWSLLCHLATEGVFTLGEAGAAEAVAEILSIWSALVAEDLVPPESLDDVGDTPALKRWAGGDHCASFTMDYLAADAFGLANAPLGVPVALPGTTGTPLMPGHALVCLRSGMDEQRRERAIALAAWIGGPEVHRRWHREHFFPVAFAEACEDVARHEGIFPAAQAQEAVARIAADRARAVTSPMTQASGALAWSALADREIRAALRDPDTDLGATAWRVVKGWRG